MNDKENKKVYLKVTLWRPRHLVIIEGVLREMIVDAVNMIREEG